MDDILFYLKILTILSITKLNLSLVINTKDGSVYRSDKLNFQQFTVTIRHIPKGSSEINLENSAVILTQDLNDLNEFNIRAVLSNEFPQKLRFIGVYGKSRPRDVETGKPVKPVDALQGHITQYEYIMEVEPAKINLITLEFFSKEICGFSIPIINTFDKESLEWEKELKYEEKYMNFNNCDLKIGVRHMGTHLAYYSSNELKGFIKDVGDALGRAGNFKPLYIDYDDPRNAPLYEANVKMHVRLASGFYSKFHRKCCHITRTFDQVEQNFALTKSEAYNSYEKLILPFDATTWYLVIITFSLAFVVIFLARFLPQSVRNYIFGEGIDTPAFNVVGTFFGIGQIRLPDGNFPRFILMMFIIFCLIIRTAYQGVQFDMLTKDMRKPLPKTLHDLCMRNYTIVVEYQYLDGDESSLKYLTELMDKNEKPNIIAVKHSLAYFESQIENSSAKLAFPLTTELTKSQFVSNKTFIILEETFFTAQEGFVLFKNNFMFHLTDRVVQCLIPAGIIQRLKDYHFEIMEAKEDPEDEGPSVFSVPDLSFGFVLWLAACGASFSVFVVERLIPKVKHFIGTTIALILLLNAIKWRINRIVVD